MNSGLKSISEIRPHLFLAGYGCITASALKQYGITNAVDATNLNSKPISGLEKIEVPVEDTIIQKISNYFETVVQYVDEVKAKGGKTVIYCGAGVSRSATLTIMYLVISENLPLDQAYYTVNQARRIISPNVGFWRQMIDYEKQKSGGTSTVELITGRMARPIPSVYLHRSIPA
ncbi:unnamed protein product [Caenorhabditis angaria]|uniref:Protein-tyrosine-phosphatase n=1 Tax=Caenorhabditis angaria TaxID=860376 RepID=A0A9P1NAP5_9PELO|nr:unnamed protein product [Caenorhabditis angaria]